MKCKTPVTIIWRDRNCDWHWFYAREITKDAVLLTGADSPQGHVHDGDTFWCLKSEIKSIESGHVYKEECR